MDKYLLKYKKFCLILKKKIQEQSYVNFYQISLTFKRYDEPLTKLTKEVENAPWVEVDVLERGAEALRVGFYVYKALLY